MKILTKDPSASYKSGDRGPLEFESKLHEEEGEIMKIANRNVFTISPSLPIKEASEIMVERGVRRLPVASPGTKKFQGMIVSRDIVDFLGGGDKHQIIEKKHSKNFLSAINDSSEIIMNPSVPYVKKSSSISETAKLLSERGVGGVPILDKKKAVEGIVSERDFASYIPAPANVQVEVYMTQNVVTTDPNLFLIDAMKRMISEGFRRLPVVEDGGLEGILTSVDILDYFASSEIFDYMSTGDASDAISIEINQIMTEDPLSVSPKDDLGETARKMEEKGYSGLPVVEDEELVGIITERDILELLI